MVVINGLPPKLSGCGGTMLRRGGIGGGGKMANCCGARMGTGGGTGRIAGGEGLSRRNWSKETTGISSTRFKGGWGSARETTDARLAFAGVYRLRGPFSLHLRPNSMMQQRSVTSKQNKVTKAPKRNIAKKSP